MKLHILQHEQFESPAYVERWAKEAGASISFTNFFNGDDLPRQSDFDMLVILGGTMSAWEDDKFPWLADERVFIKEAISSGIKTLGICLGSQLIASAMGARVYKNSEKEIGWFPVRLSEAGQKSFLGECLPEEFMALHWHGDTFDLPEEAVLLASSTACKNQAYLIGEHVLALQFHLEFDIQTATGLCNFSKKDFQTDGKFIQPPEEILASEKLFLEANSRLAAILSRFAGI
ncbi:MAG: type 1 glutamine amidotransferase [Candidatus Dadabacteria bacterium]|nr:MAG: type 1 glutamine amidotransferase [Candidatus Dadabacteria bacterium]